MADTKTAKAGTDTEEATAKAPAAAASSSEVYAIVEASGTQMWVQANRYYDVDRLHAEVDDTIKLENVLLVRASGDTIALSPALIVEKAEIDQMMELLADGIRKAG